MYMGDPYSAKRIPTVSMSHLYYVRAFHGQTELPFIKSYDKNMILFMYRYNTLSYV